MENLDTLKTSTVCEKISLFEKNFEATIKTKKMTFLEYEAMLKLLRDIRRDAQRMEDGLKRRQKKMVEAKIEDQYQKEKESSKKKWFESKQPFSSGKPVFKIFVQNVVTGEVMYDKQVHAGVVNFVDRLDGFDEDGFMLGATSPLAFGNDLAIFFAYDQLHQAIYQIIGGVTARIQEAVRLGIIKNINISKELDTIKKLTNIEEKGVIG